MNSQQSPKAERIDILLTALATIGIVVVSLTVQDMTGFILGLGVITIALIIVRFILARISAHIRAAIRREIDIRIAETIPQEGVR